MSANEDLEGYQYCPYSKRSDAKCYLYCGTVKNIITVWLCIIKILTQNVVVGLKSGGIKFNCL